MGDSNSDNVDTHCVVGMGERVDIGCQDFDQRHSSGRWFLYPFRRRNNQDKVRAMIKRIVAAAGLLMIAAVSASSGDLRISGYPPTPSSPTGAELFPCVQGGTTYKCTVTQAIGGTFLISPAADIGAQINAEIVANGTGKYILPPGHYSAATTITTAVPITLECAGSGSVPLGSNAGTCLITFAVGVDGFICQGTAEGTSIKGISFFSLNTASGTNNGLNIGCKRFMGQDLVIQKFGNDGIHHDSSQTGSPWFAGNSSHWRLDNVQTYGNFRDNFHWKGADVNVGQCLDCSSYGAGRNGFDDTEGGDSNLFLGPHANGDTVHDYNLGSYNKWTLPYCEGTGTMQVVGQNNILESVLFGGCTITETTPMSNFFEGWPLSTQPELSNNYRNNWWVQPLDQLPSTGTPVAGTANLIVCHAGRVALKQTFLTVGEKVTTLSAANNFQIAVYADTGFGNITGPGALLAKTGNMSTGATGFVHANFQSASVTVSTSVSPYFTWTGNPLLNTQVVQISAGTLPAPFAANTNYYVRDVAGNTFNLALAPSGAAVVPTTTGATVVANQVVQAGPRTTAGSNLWWCHNQSDSVAAFLPVTLASNPSQGAINEADVFTMGARSCSGAACNGGSSTFGTMPSTLSGSAPYVDVTNLSVPAVYYQVIGIP
jgi:hypothetical protein